MNTDKNSHYLYGSTWVANSKRTNTMVTRAGLRMVTRAGLRMVTRAGLRSCGAL
jgi:hypothetical protein